MRQCTHQGLQRQAGRRSPAPPKPLWRRPVDGPFTAAAVGLFGAVLLCSGGAPSAAAASQGSDVPQTDIGRESGTLSDKLGATSGVIHPEGSVDPKMQKPAPATGTMPVIPPPGSPGGQPGLVPK